MEVLAQKVLGMFGYLNRTYSIYTNCSRRAAMIPMLVPPWSIQLSVSWKKGCSKNAVTIFMP